MRRELYETEDRLLLAISASVRASYSEIAELADAPLQVVHQFLAEWLRTRFVVAVPEMGVMKYRQSHPGDEALEAIDPEHAFSWLDLSGALTDEFRTADQIARRGKMQPHLVRHLLKVWEAAGGLQTLRRNGKVYWATRRPWAG